MSMLKGVKGELDARVTANVEVGLGKTIKVAFIATYEKLPRPVLKEVVEKARAGEITDEDCVRQYLRGWRDLKGHDDQDIPYCADALEEMLSSTEYTAALVEGFNMVQFGSRLANAKN